MQAQPLPYRIGLDARFYRSGTGGIGRYSRELIAHLAALDHFNQYTVFLTPDDLPEWQLQQENFRIVVLPIKHYSLAEQTKLLTALQREKLDLVHFLNFNHPLLYRRPFVTTLHDLTVYFAPVGRSQKSALRRLAFVQTLKRSLRSARRVIAVSEHSAKDAEKIFGVSQTKIDVIFHGGPQALQFSVGSKTQIQEFLGSRQRYFLFVSQWRPHKGILTLIEAFNQFKAQTGLPHQLVLTGNQKVSQQAVQEAMAHSPYLSDILTPGFVPDTILPALYHQAAAFILPSEYEGFGLPVLEAFAYEVPVIVADNSSLPEVADNAALYFPSKDASALAARMQELAADPRLARSLVEKGRERLKRFSWQKCAEQTLATYYKALEKRQ